MRKDIYFEKLIKLLKVKSHNELIETENLIKLGKSIIVEERYSDWEFLVRKFSDSKYQNQNLITALSIMDELDIKKDIEKAKALLTAKSNFEKMAITYVVFYFSLSGPEFYRQTTDYELTDKIEMMLERKEIENKQFDAKTYKKQP